jgi:hypothetical protein
MPTDSQLSSTSDANHEDAPLLSLLTQPLDSLTQDELGGYVKKLQDASQNVQAIKSTLTTKKTTVKKKKANAKADATALLSDLGI